ncbi:MAG: L,D-transpeptidase family protein [Selenomonadaceae bacterium]|nr:L,D-transpeptidase family protein [Selenomonadaceae bacterium]
MYKYLKILFVMCLTITTTISAVFAREASPDWVRKLPAAKNAAQLFIVAGVGETTAWVSFHEKDANGVWTELMTTPAFIGKAGLGKTKEGDKKTPVGKFRFDAALGLAIDPGCKIPYTQVNENHYWSGDVRPGMMYNQLVDIRQTPGLDKKNSEHLVEYSTHYAYILNISYNEKCLPGKGSALFLHCMAPKKPFTGGCVAIPESKMKFVMQNVIPDCVVIIDDLRKLSPETAKEWEI